MGGGTIAVWGGGDPHRAVDHLVLQLSSILTTTIHGPIVYGITGHLTQVLVILYNGSVNDSSDERRQKAVSRCIDRTLIVSIMIDVVDKIKHRGEIKIVKLPAVENKTFTFALIIKNVTKSRLAGTILKYKIEYQFYLLQ